MMKNRTAEQIKSEIAKLKAQLAALESTKKPTKKQQLRNAAVWACNPESESYWSM
jgi:hypothetical protein